MYIVFIFLYAVFYNCHHPFGSLRGEGFLDQWSSNNGVRKESSAWRLFVGCVLNCLYRKLKQAAIFSFMQCKILTIDVSCFIR